MLTLKLALRSIKAHGQRSLILLAVVGFISMLLFLFLSFSDGEIENFKGGVMGIYNPATDIKVYRSGARESIDQHEDDKVVLSQTLTDYQTIVENLKTLDFVKNTYSPGTPVSQDLYFKGEKYRNFLFRSFDGEKDQWLKDKIRIFYGVFPRDTQDPQILLHKASRVMVGAKPGDMITVMGRTLFGQAVSLEAVLAGYYLPEVDNPNLGTVAMINPVGYLQISGFNPGETLALNVDLKKGQDKEGALKELRSLAQKNQWDLSFYDFDKIPSDVFNIYEMIRVIILFMTGIILFIITVGIMNIVAVNLYDRKKEIGTFYCLGAERPFLIRLYTLEILLTNLVCAALGILAGLGIRQIINSLGITTEDTGLQLVFGGSVFNLGFNSASVLWIMAGTGLLTILTALFTLGKALKVSPVSAIKDEE